MKHSAEPTVTAGLSIFEKTCGYCGAHFRVLVSRVPDHVGLEEYACPECGRRYQADAAAEPEVQLLRPRADGKDDRYQETMF